jgi:hypothetical protein
MRTGTPRFDGLTIGELTANFMQGPGTIELKAKVAFVNSKTGKTHGWTNHNTWTPAVLAKLKELTDMMEEEVAQVQFEGGSSTNFGASSPSPGIGGLGEHLSKGDEPPQV